MLIISPWALARLSTEVQGETAKQVALLSMAGEGALAKQVALLSREAEGAMGKQGCTAVPSVNGQCECSTCGRHTTLQ
eukprot:354593-Chlamydomonas_euryale.AAC.1